MNEADERFASRLAEDLERYLGPEIKLADLDLGEADAVAAHLRATCVYEGGRTVLEADGETRLDAYNELVVRAAELRLVVAMRRMDPDTATELTTVWLAGIAPERRA